MEDKVKAKRRTDPDLTKIINENSGKTYLNIKLKYYYVKFWKILYNMLRILSFISLIVIVILTIKFSIIDKNILNTVMAFILFIVLYIFNGAIPKE